MSAAKIASDGRITILDAKAGADEVVTEKDVQEPSLLAKLLGRILATLAALRRPWSPARLDFEDMPVSTAGAVVALQHNFNGRVRWWICGWQSTGTSAPILRETSTAPLTDANTLYLQSYVAGTACIRVEESG